ncbi:putative 60S acidic ribosomal protein P0-3 [Monocercomonoides exilis]|uniref:putative 60S acidic ribosomal protein P0-3 n=1 Tax=Monocercomonoides exilis TaxID=2049356 RepID=UPI003559F2B5|nr:putative 60S acidic ribosomal protein P0-3 [Monocercomonoides exilis]|eukprot:MONOS_11372.1-p1 / transcript=MONOS_11372.1 / gene=MONOS_11372 / organism=Monocercomonoides_exilis_PA203 / gene_product=60S acidic ribosomal protein P0-3 / transcript_product=60S acidic ribosomal protein P0-3 / location=Mono_scaffold00567:17467-18423(+) / protein_length=319 / sequence_SO=supercontig / SO=protein_coding / is_pseudo=false
MATKKEKKALYFEKVVKLFAEYEKVMVVSIDNVSSALMQQTRHALRGKAVMLMGKNTLIRRAMTNVKNIPGLHHLTNALKSNVGLIFTNGDLSEVRDIIAKNKISGPAKPGSIAPCDVVVPKGNTGLEPGQTTFLQALNIATKITKGTIEILNDVKVITKGEKVGNSEAALLSKLKITPFFFEITPVTIFENGSMFPIDILDVKDEDLEKAFIEGNQKLTAFCMSTGVPCAGAIPYYLKEGFKNMCAVCEATSYEFPLFKKFSESVVVAAPAAAAASSSDDSSSSSSSSDKAESKKEDKKEEPAVEEEEQDLGGLFDF